LEALAVIAETCRQRQSQSDQLPKVMEQMRRTKNEKKYIQVIEWVGVSNEQGRYCGKRLILLEEV
jgi:hypothetical protein